MTQLKRFQITGLSIIILSSLSSAQWTQTNGPYGGMMKSLAVSGTNIFVGTNGGGVFRSTNNGTSWTAVNNGLTNFTVNVFAVSSTNVFAATNGGGVYLSTDNGANWSAFNNGLSTNALWVNALVVSGTNIFAGINGVGVYRSTNNGTNWTFCSGLTPYTGVTALVVSDTNLFAATEGGIYRSTDNGASWTVTGMTYSGFNTLASFPNGSGGKNLFGGAGGAGIWRSTDLGVTWTGASAGLVGSVGGVYAYNNSGSNLYAGTGNGVYVSTNNGTNWTRVNSGLTDTSVSTLAVSGTNLFAGTSYGGVFRSTDNGATWNSANTGLTNTWVSSFGVSGTTLFSCTSSGLFRTTDAGTSWVWVSSIRNGSFDGFAASGTNLYAAGGWVNLSTDNGTSWTQLSTWPTGALGAVAVAPNGTGGTNLFAGTNYGVYRSTNYGTSWTNTGLIGGDVYTFAVSGGNIFVGDLTGVYLSTDYGTSWNVKGGSSYVDAVAVSGTNLFCGGANHGGVHLSTDNGTSWAAAGLTNLNVTALAVSGTNIFAATVDDVFLSSNNGTTWTSTGLNNSYVRNLAVSGTDLYAATYGHGVFKRALSDILPVELASFGASARGSMVKLRWITATETNNYVFEVERRLVSDVLWSKIGSVIGAGTSNTPHNYIYNDIRVAQSHYAYRLKQVDRDGQFKYSESVEVNVTATPLRFGLDQNFPNPFNPSTTIRYALPSPSNAKIVITNTLGQEVAMFANGQEEAGYHEVQWNANIASGIYFYRIEAVSTTDPNNRFTQVKKMLLLK